MRGYISSAANLSKTRQYTWSYLRSVSINIPEWKTYRLSLRITIKNGKDEKGNKEL